MSALRNARARLGNHPPPTRKAMTPRPPQIRLTTPDGEPLTDQELTPSETRWAYDSAKRIYGVLVAVKVEACKSAGKDVGGPVPSWEAVLAERVDRVRRHRRNRHDKSN